MIDAAKNFAKATLSTGYDASATSIVLSSGHGAKLAVPPFNATWWNFTDYPDPTDDPNVEIVRVTAISTDTLTITRAQEGTSASTKNTGGKTYKLVAGLTAKVVNEDVGPSVLTGSMFYESDDFLAGGSAAGQSKLTWQGIASGAGTKSFLDGLPDHPGLVRLQTATTIDNTYSLQLQNYASNYGTLPRHDNVAGWEYHFIFRIPDVTNIVASAGLSDLAWGSGAKGCSVELDTSKNANLRFVVTTTGPTYNYDSTTIAVANNDWIHARIRSLVLGKWAIAVSKNAGAWSTERTFGTGGCDNTVTLPTDKVDPCFYVKTLSAAVRNVDIDFFSSRFPVTR
jgi:hypothetical protein